jgi:hypothetical protein
MTTNRTLTDSEIEALADEAEAGYDIDHLVVRRNKRGRPTLGAGPASVESVRLDPELKDQLLLRAEQAALSYTSGEKSVSPKPDCGACSAESASSTRLALMRGAASMPVTYSARYQNSARLR